MSRFKGVYITINIAINVIITFPCKAEFANSQIGGTSRYEFQGMRKQLFGSVAKYVQGLKILVAAPCILREYSTKFLTIYFNLWRLEDACIDENNHMTYWN